MTIRMNYQLLTSQISTQTIKDLFLEETKFLQKFVWLFTEQQPEILLGWNSGSLSIAQLQAVRSMMVECNTRDEIAREQAADEAEWAAKVADSKVKQQMANPASLTSSHRQGY